MKLTSISTVFVTIICLNSILLFTVSGASPPNPPTNPMLFTEDNAGTPYTVDPSIAYDTASGEMIFNVYDTLIIFNAEHVDQYVGSIADQWWSQNITGTTSPEGIPWYWRYTFHIKPGIHFAAPYNYALTGEDVQFSFWRTMILDAVGGPEWMIDEPLLNNAGGPNYMGYNLNSETDVNNLGSIIDQSVGRLVNASGDYVWFNIAYPAPYSPFLQILCQTWSSILSKQYINNQIIANGTNDWSGNWAAASTLHPSWIMNHTGWIDQFDVYTGMTGPLDVGGPHMYGSGPFMLTNIDFVNRFWTMTRNPAYFRGWPADYPVMANVGPAGYVNDIRVNFGVDWATRAADLVSGAADFAAIPRNHLDAVYTTPSPPYNPPTNYPQDGIRCTPNIPTLQAEVMCFTFDISTGGLYGPINAPGVFSSDGIPSDFFSNPVWGIHVRKAFAYAIDYATYISTGYFGEAQHVYTALIPGLPYYDPTVKGYDYNLTVAAAELAQVPGIMQHGFTIRLLWNTGNLARQTLANLLSTALASINSTFVGIPLGLAWGSVLLPAALRHEVPTFCVGWLADFPDMHDFALPFYGSAGNYPIWQNYANSTMDALISQGIATPDGPARQAIYAQIQQLVVADVPSVALLQPLGRHFERDSVVGWYYNPIYPGLYFYNMWKWYYIPHVLYNPPVQNISDALGVDVNYDGKVDGKDIATVARSFRALAGPPIDSTWNFRCDINLDRKVDMKDIAYVAIKFNPPRTTDRWVPTP